MDPAHASPHRYDLGTATAGRTDGHRRAARHLIALVTLAMLASALALVAPAAVSPAQAAPGVHPGGDWVDVAVGVNHVCARSAKGEVRCWGSGFFGQLGNESNVNIGDNAGEMGDNLATVDLGTGRTATALAAGYLHTCAILDDGSVKCWGRNNTGELGVGNTFNLGDDPNEMGDNLPTVDLGTGRTATAISAGDEHTCALLDDGNVKCWGANSDGQLGQGDKIVRGDNAGEMGDNLPAIDLGLGRTAVAISSNAKHNCVVLDNALVKCWGNNDDGQLGQGDTIDRGDDAPEMGDTLAAVALGTGRTATAVSVGAGQSCALLDDASVKCWGAGGVGQLGYGNGLDLGDNLVEMGDNLPTVDFGGGRDVVSLVVGGAHSCVRLEDLDFKCWGFNGSGQLLLEDITNRGDNALEMGDNLPAADFGGGRFVTAAGIGPATSCVVLDDNSIRCWGMNKQRPTRPRQHQSLWRHGW